MIGGSERYFINLKPVFCLKCSEYISCELKQIILHEVRINAREVKVYSHLTFAFVFAFASTSPSKLNIASMVSQTQTHRMGLNPFLTFYIDVMFNFNFEHTLRLTAHKIR